MRGKEAAHDLDKARRGITPAYAGKSDGVYTHGIWE